MTSSLVGSEMCIRDRQLTPHMVKIPTDEASRIGQVCYDMSGWQHCLRPVSYTHLTLPTICSV
eukprot:4282322-Prorocentrum_lima.AAC.1